MYKCIRSLSLSHALTGLLSHPLAEARRLLVGVPFLAHVAVTSAARAFPEEQQLTVYVLTCISNLAAQRTC
jgi:hypothetical protein